MISMITPKRDLYLNNTENLYGKKGKWYTISRISYGDFVFVDERGNEHYYDEKTLNKHYHTIDFKKGFDYKSDERFYNIKEGKFFGLMSVNVSTCMTNILKGWWEITRYSNQEAPSEQKRVENWCNTISESKFTRCINTYPCKEVDKGVWYNPITAVVYKKITNCSGEEVFVGVSLLKYKRPEDCRAWGKDKYDELYNKTLRPQIAEDWKVTAYDKFVNMVTAVDECLPYGKVKSDGGKSDYYKIVLPEWVLKKHSEKGFIMLEDIAEVMFKNDFNFINVFKAQKRMFEMTQGGGKEGNTFEYDATKCKYYVDKQVEVFNR